MIKKRCSSYNSLVSVVVKNAIHFLLLVGFSSSLLLSPGISNAYRVDMVFIPLSMGPETTSYIRDDSGFDYDFGHVPSGASAGSDPGWGYSANRWKDSTGNIHSEALVHMQVKSIIDTRSAQGPVSAYVSGQSQLDLLFYITPEYGTKGPNTAQLSVMADRSSGSSDLIGARLEFPAYFPGEEYSLFRWDWFDGPTSATIVLPTPSQPYDEFYWFSANWRSDFSVDNQYGFFSDLAYVDFRLSVVEEPIPEPATMLLLGSGLIGLAGYGRKKFFKK